MTAPKVLDKQIASVGHIEQLPDGRDTYVIDRPGMMWEEIQEHFPPKGRPGPHGYNRRGLIRAIIYEAYVEARNGDERDPMNVRGFWYDRLLGTIRRVAGDEGDQKTIDSTINEAWGDLVEAGYATYAGMNITSAKSGNYHIAVKPSSPYPRTILLVEKQDHFEPLHDLADTYEITFVATGGQNSRCAAMEFAEQLEKAGVDTTKGFTVYSFCDFDPEGWDIPNTFIDHLSLKIDARIELVRLGVLPEQITEDVMRYQGSPYSPETKTGAAAKGVATKYAHFVEETGGCFMPDTGKAARVELNMYKNEEIRERILAGLSKYIDGFEYQKTKLKEAIMGEHSRAWRTYCDTFKESVNELYDAYFSEISEVLDQLGVERTKRAPEARQRKKELLQKIEQLDRQIEAATGDIGERESALDDLRLRLSRQAEAEDIHDYIPSDFPGANELIAEVEDNGGWRRWVEDLDIEAVDGAALANAARRHADFDWRPEQRERDRIWRWILDQFPEMGDLEGPAESPAELVEAALRAEWGANGHGEATNGGSK